MADYYEILGVSEDASAKEIKRSFRAKAKMLHPDATIDGPISDEAFKELLAAYSVLSHSSKREEYDRARRFYEKGSFNYREFLKSRIDDPESQSRLIFHDLLYNQEGEALFLFEEFVYKKNYALEEYMDREDFMDCAFLLAEEYEKKREYVKAFNLLKKITLFEREKPYFRHFMQEVADRLRYITCNKMSRKVSTNEQIKYIQEVIKLNLSRKMNERLKKKIEQLYNNG